MEKLFDLVNWTVHSYKYGVDGKTDADATLKIKVRGKVVEKAAAGVGPVDALANVLRETLREFYPAIDDVTVVDYNSHIKDSQKGTAAEVKVTIKLLKEGQCYTAEAVSTNIIEASWQAFVEGASVLLGKEAR